MTYEQALEYISKQGRFAMKLGTERTRLLLDEIGAPDRKLEGVLIAGTNGKGSTGACLTAMLRAAGHRVGFMPKPHLISYTERIELDGKPISEQEFVDTLESLLPVFDRVAADIGPPTEFEMLTVLAVAFLAPRIDVLVCEVGLGGRLDATNALDLGVAAITNVDLDHQKYLGSTIREIAGEKAAIIKLQNRVVTGCEGEALEIVEARAKEMDASVWRLGGELSVESMAHGWDGHVLSVAGPGFEHKDLRLSLVGDYQPENAALAVAAAHRLGEIDDRAVRDGLASTVWAGRLQVIAKRPRVILDGGHNPAAMTKAGISLRRLIGSERLVVVFGMLSERDPDQLLGALHSLRPDAAVFTEAKSARGHAISGDDLAGRFGPGAEVARPAPAALDRARELAGPDGNVLVCGSLYLVGEILASLNQGGSRAGSEDIDRRSRRASEARGPVQSRPTKGRR